MGVEPVWFAIMFAICLQTSFPTPPVGFSLFYIKGVCPPGITTRHIYLGVAVITCRWRCLGVLVRAAGHLAA